MKTSPGTAKSVKGTASAKKTSAIKGSARGTRSKSGSANTGSRRGASAPRDFDEYLATIPELARMPLIGMREAIRSAVPAGAVEVISYGIPAFKRKKMLVWFGGFSAHCSLYPTAAVLDEFKDDLRAYTTSKGTVQFPLTKPLPIALIKKLVKARVASVRE